MAGGQDGQLPTQFLAEEKVPPDSRGAPHYTLPHPVLGSELRLCWVLTSENEYYIDFETNNHKDQI